MEIEALEIARIITLKFCCKREQGNVVIVLREGLVVVFNLREIIACWFAVGNDLVKNL